MGKIRNFQDNVCRPCGLNAPEQSLASGVLLFMRQE